MSSRIAYFYWIGVGDFVKFGRYPQTAEGEIRPVEWMVLSKDYIYGRMLLISRYGLDEKRFDGSSKNWDNSEIRQWLNNEFYYNTFSIEEMDLIISSHQDNVFLLSEEEADKYFSNNDARKCKPTSYAKANGAYDTYGYCWWWLRDPSDIGFSEEAVNCINDRGKFTSRSCNSSNSVRPALWIG